MHIKMFQSFYDKLYHSYQLVKVAVFYSCKHESEITKTVTTNQCS